jgi:hypothetical protein
VSRPGAGAAALVAVGVLTAACRRDAAPAAVPEVDAATTAAAARLVSHERLGALLPPAEAGWSAAPVTSATIMLPAPAAHATTNYTRGQSRIDLEITDTGGDPAFVEALATVAGTNFSQKAANGYMKGLRVGNFPAIESWNHVDRAGEVTVLISRRFVVHASGVNLDGIDTLQGLIGRVDLAAVNGLAGPHQP